MANYNKTMENLCKTTRLYAARYAVCTSFPPKTYTRKALYYKGFRVLCTLCTLFSEREKHIKTECVFPGKSEGKRTRARGSYNNDVHNVQNVHTSLKTLIT